MTMLERDWYWDSAVVEAAPECFDEMLGSSEQWSWYYLFLFEAYDDLRE